MHTVCRTGKNFNKAPLCPYFACADPECTECEEGWEKDPKLV